MRDCDLFLAVGTSGTVSPASKLVRSAKFEGARMLLANLEAMAGRDPAYDEEIVGAAEVVLPRLLSPMT